jgi:septal ring factor EnvC (AmiA/AmiB activator)
MSADERDELAAAEACLAEAEAERDRLNETIDELRDRVAALRHARLRSAQRRSEDGD